MLKQHCSHAHVLYVFFFFNRGRGHDAGTAACCALRAQLQDGFNNHLSQAITQLFAGLLSK